MIVNVLMKSISKGANRITPIPYEFSETINTVEELIGETVKLCLKKYRKPEQAIPLKERALSGKVVYDAYSHRNPPKERDAVRNALDAFSDGVIAIFIDGEKMKNLTDKVMLREGSELMFVKLTALSGSCLLLDWIF